MAETRSKRKRYNSDREQILNTFEGDRNLYDLQTGDLQPHVQKTARYLEPEFETGMFSKMFSKAKHGIKKIFNKFSQTYRFKIGYNIMKTDDPKIYYIYFYYDDDKEQDQISKWIPINYINNIVRTFIDIDVSPAIVTRKGIELAIRFNIDKKGIDVLNFLTSEFSNAKYCNFWEIRKRNVSKDENEYMFQLLTDMGRRVSDGTAFVHEHIISIPKKFVRDDESIVLD